MATGPKETDPLTAGLNRQVVEVKGMMQQNIGALLERGEHLNELEGRAAKLREDADIFKTKATDLQESTERPPGKWWIVLLAVLGVFCVILILVVIIVSTVLGLKT